MVYHFGMEFGPETKKDKKKIKGPDMYALIRQAITSGRFVPGQRLSERELAVQYGVSRTPIREAFRHLIQEGLVVYKPNSGYRIIPLSEELARHILVVRETLESIAARLAAQRDPKGTAEKMVETIAKARRAYREGQLSELISRQSEFSPGSGGKQREFGPGGHVPDPPGIHWADDECFPLLAPASGRDNPGARGDYPGSKKRKPRCCGESHPAARSQCLRRCPQECETVPDPDGKVMKEDQDI